jgi:hypothetical protein
MAGGNGPAKDGILEEFNLGHIAYRAVQEGGDKRRVPVAHVVGGQNHGAVFGHILPAVDFGAEKEFEENAENQL